MVGGLQPAGRHPGSERRGDEDTISSHGDVPSSVADADDSSPDLDVANPVTIHRAGPLATIVDGQGASGVFEVRAPGAYHGPRDPRGWSSPAAASCRTDTTLTLTVREQLTQPRDPRGRRVGADGVRSYCWSASRSAATPASRWRCHRGVVGERRRDGHRSERDDQRQRRPEAGGERGSARVRPRHARRRRHHDDRHDDARRLDPRRWRQRHRLRRGRHVGGEQPRARHILRARDVRRCERRRSAPRSAPGQRRRHAHARAHGGEPGRRRGGRLALTKDQRARLGPRRQPDTVAACDVGAFELDPADIPTTSTTTTTTPGGARRRRPRWPVVRADDVRRRTACSPGSGDVGRPAPPAASARARDVARRSASSSGAESAAGSSAKKAKKLLKKSAALVKKVRTKLACRRAEDVHRRARASAPSDADACGRDPRAAGLSSG